MGRPAGRASSCHSSPAGQPRNLTGKPAGWHLGSVPVQWAGRQSGGCQREAGQAGSRLWKKASHRAILDDSIAKSARPRKKKNWVAAQTPEKKNMAGLPVRHSSQLAGRPAWQPGSSLPGGWQSHLDRRSVHAPCQAPAIGQAGQPPEPPGIARQPANIGSHFQCCV